MLSVDELRADVETGAVDTVIAAFTDMQGRLMGKRLDAEFFLDELDSGNTVEGCNYLLALEMDMDPVPGYALASWERGYGDFGLKADLETLRRIPWHEATALVLGTAVLLPAFIFLAVRLSLASPMTFETKRIDLRGAWRLTQGRFWPLLGTYFIAFALSIVVVVLTFAIAVAAVAVAGGGMGALGAAFQSDMSTMASVLTPARMASPASASNFPGCS